MAIPDGCVGLIWPRSGHAVKRGLDVFAGVIDSGYRGNIGVCLYNSGAIVADIYQEYMVLLLSVREKYTL